MSARYFCDGCGEEIVGERRGTRDQQGRLFGRVPIPGRNKTMFAQVLVGTDQTWNRGDYCAICIATCLRAALTPSSVDALAPEHGVNPRETLNGPK